MSDHIIREELATTARAFLECARVASDAESRELACIFYERACTMLGFERLPYTNADVLAICQESGNKVAAIKAVRARWGLTLVEAKVLVDTVQQWRDHVAPETVEAA